MSERVSMTHRGNGRRVRFIGYPSLGWCRRVVLVGRRGRLLVWSGSGPNPHPPSPSGRAGAAAVTHGADAVAGGETAENCRQQVWRVGLDTLRDKGPNILGVEDLTGRDQLIHRIVDVLSETAMHGCVGGEDGILALVAEGGAGGGHADFSPHSGSDSTYRSSSERANRLPECDLTGMTCPCACRSSSFLGDMSR